MRYPKERIELTRQAIVATASRRFRQEGIDAVGVASLMQSAGLTHGGFYKHFPSKEALVGETATEAFHETLPQLRDYVMQRPAGKRLKALANAYVSAMHRNQPASGCFGAALVSEVGRQSPQVREAVDDQLEAFLTMIGEFAKADDCPIAPRAFLALMVGAVSLSRVPTDSGHAEGYLSDSLKMLHATIDALRAERGRQSD